MFNLYRLAHFFSVDRQFPDRDGYFWVFGNSSHGEIEARDSPQGFQGLSKSLGEALLTLGIRLFMNTTV